MTKIKKITMINGNDNENDMNMKTRMVTKMTIKLKTTMSGNENGRCSRTSPSPKKTIV